MIRKGFSNFDVFVITKELDCKMTRGHKSDVLTLKNETSFLVI